MKNTILNLLLDKNKKALVLGAGISGLSASKLLLSKGARVELHDDNVLAKFFKHENLQTFFGKTDYNIKSDISVLILSPGVPISHTLVKQAQALGLYILSEIDLAYLFLPSKIKVIGVTGTNGKSSTTVMINTIFAAAGQASMAGGNLGLPPCQILLENDLSSLEYLILELSSFQLDLTCFLRLDAAVILNITPDHLDRYENFETYIKAKLKIRLLLKPKSPLFISQDLYKYFDVNTYNINNLPSAKLNLSADLNHENANAAQAIARFFGINEQDTEIGLKNFRPLPHRLALVGEKRGIKFINDSKATTVASVENALKNITTPVHLLLGGIAKGESFACLSAKNYPQIVQFYLYGQCSKQISDALCDDKTNIYRNLASSVQQAFDNACSGDTILLSPGCSSYDQFNNFVERGLIFEKIFAGLND